MIQALKPNTAAAPPTSMYGQPATMNFEKPIRICVINGSSAPKPSNTFWNAGITKMLTTAIATAITATTKLG